MLTQLTNSLDPAEQRCHDAQCEASCAAQDLQATTVFGLHAQICELQGTITSLQAELHTAEHCYHEAVCQANWLLQQLEMYQMMHSLAPQPQAAPSHYNVQYRDGGCATYWDYNLVIQWPRTALVAYYHHKKSPTVVVLLYL
jgi:hypothetical protein